jgi:hypothetical protein
MERLARKVCHPRRKRLRRLSLEVLANAKARLWQAPRVSKGVDRDAPMAALSFGAAAWDNAREIKKGSPTEAPLRYPIVGNLIGTNRDLLTTLGAPSGYLAVPRSAR